MGRKSLYPQEETQEDFETLYETAVEAYVKSISSILKENFYVEEDKETGIKYFKDSKNKTILSARTYDYLSFGLLAFLYGYHYQPKKGE